MLTVVPDPASADQEQPVGGEASLIDQIATVRHRTKVTQGPGSRAAGLAMAFKLIESAQARWRAVNAPHLVRAGAVFVNGTLVERPDEDHAVTRPTETAA